MAADINFFAETTFRNTRKKFGIKIDDRRRHFYVIGKTGMGKTVMLENMAVQDIREIIEFRPSQQGQRCYLFQPG